MSRSEFHKEKIPAALKNSKGWEYTPTSLANEKISLDKLKTFQGMLDDATAEVYGMTPAKNAYHVRCELTADYTPFTVIRLSGVLDQKGDLDKDFIVTLDDVNDWAREIVEKLESFTQVSSDGRGLDIFVEYVETFVGYSGLRNAKGGRLQIYPSMPPTKEEQENSAEWGVTVHMTGVLVDLEFNEIQKCPHWVVDDILAHKIPWN